MYGFWCSETLALRFNEEQVEKIPDRRFQEKILDFKAFQLELAMIHCWDGLVWMTNGNLGCWAHIPEVSAVWTFSWTCSYI